MASPIRITSRRPRRVALSLRRAGNKGLGVFADRQFSPGELLLRFDGPRVALRDIVDFTHTIQISGEEFLGPSGGIDDYVNHSCEPNAGLRGNARRLELVALRCIVGGDEITFDYSTCIVDEPGIESCLCSSPFCRGRVLPFRSLSPELRAHYLALDAVPKFACRQLDPAESGGARSARATRAR